MIGTRAVPRIPRTRAWGIRLAFVTACISGVAVFVNGYGVGRFDDATVYTTAKNGVAALMLLAVLGVLASREPGSGRSGPQPPARRAGLVLIGVVGGSIPFVLFFEGLARASSTDAAFIHKTLVVWVAVLAVPILRERLSVLHLGAIALLVGGQAALAGDLGSIGAGSGEALILVATLMWAAEFVLAKRVLRSLGSLTVGTARMGIGLIVLLGWLLLTGRGDDLAGLAAHQWAWALLTGGILAGFVACWYAALARAQAVDAAAVLVFGAVVTTALAGGFRGLPLGAPDALGLILISLGAAVAAAASLRLPGLRRARR